MKTDRLRPTGAALLTILLADSPAVDGNARRNSQERQLRGNI